LEHDIYGHTEYSAKIFLIDLSTSGALVEHGRFLKPGSELSLRLLLGAHSLKVRTSVVHCSVHDVRHLPGKAESTVYRVGLKFINLDPPGSQVIRDLIMERFNNERREQPRLYIGRSAQIEESIELRALNIGSRGGLFSIGYPLELDNEYSFVFRVPAGAVKARGVVRHCRAWSRGEAETRFQVGVEFLNFESDGEKLVLEYLDAMERKETSLTEL
jgi:c-di-GMP-binding flagellar brake protein YcgR